MVPGGSKHSRFVRVAAAVGGVLAMGSLAACGGTDDQSKPSFTVNPSGPATQTSAASSSAPSSADPTPAGPSGAEADPATGGAATARGGEANRPQSTATEEYDGAATATGEGGSGPYTIPTRVPERLPTTIPRTIVVPPGIPTPPGVPPTITIPPGVPNDIPGL